jgi:hypothetical protein
VTITRVGTNAKYAEGWEAAFKGAKSAANSDAKKTNAKKKASPKKAGKKK